MDLNQKMNKQKLLLDFWGYESFRPLQEEIIDQILQKKDVLALLPTGGGKSICYQLPALLLDGLCIVVSPLIALMKDQIDLLRKKNIPAEMINSSLAKKDIDRIKKNLKKKPLTPKQRKLDVNKDGQLEASDFEMLRKKKSVVSAMTGGQIVAMMYDD